MYSTAPAIVLGSVGLRPLGADEAPVMRPERPVRAAVVPQDRVTISPGARALQAGSTGEPPASPASDASVAGVQSASGRAEPVTGQGEQLTPGQQQEVAELRARDAEVRAHEAAHQSAGGDLTGGASFTYQLGPDGRQYAVGGEVPVQLRSGRTADETIANAERVQRAALAPASPSAQDLAVAGSAARLEADARAQKAYEAGQAYTRARRRAGQDVSTESVLASPGRGDAAASAAA